MLPYLAGSHCMYVSCQFSVSQLFVVRIWFFSSKSTICCNLQTEFSIKSTYIS